MASPPYFKFTTVPNVFASFAAECAANPTLKVSTQPSLGLLERTYDTDGEEDMKGKTQWERFARWVEWLNENAEEGTCYKVLYLTRHGLGFHNVQNQKVGTVEWDVSYLH